MVVVVGEEATTSFPFRAGFLVVVVAAFFLVAVGFLSTGATFGVPAATALAFAGLVVAGLAALNVVLRATFVFGTGRFGDGACCVVVVVVLIVLSCSATSAIMNRDMSIS